MSWAVALLAGTDRDTGRRDRDGWQSVYVKTKLKQSLWAVVEEVMNTQDEQESDPFLQEVDTSHTNNRSPPPPSSDP